MWPDGLSLVLRFRDLVTTPGDSLELHRKLLGPKKPRVWWGWWNKAGERAPAEVFQHLQEIAHRDGLPVYLFDSGRARLHRARCTDIQWRSAPFPSPKRTATPAYYRDQQYVAWFELAEIEAEETPPAELHQWSYYRVDAFFQNVPSRFETFYDKRVSSLEELRQQDRSVWFVRPFEPQHRTHEVSLLDARTLSPDNFPSDFQQLEEDTLLWLSDPHYSVDGHHAFARLDRPGERPGERTLDHAIQRELGDRKVGGLLISGDLTWKSHPSEFEQAKDMIWRLFGGMPYRVAICPGNHDLAFSKDPADKNARIGTVAADARAAWSEFYTRLYYLPPDPLLASGRRFLVGNAVPVEVACLNSSHLQQYPEAFQGHGFVGDDQLDRVADRMGWSRHSPRSMPFRMVMLHHHVVPVTHRELPKAHQSYSVVLDAVALLRWCVRHGVRLILHGHMHQPHVSRLSLRRDDGGWHEITIASMGSSGVEQTHLGEVAKNTFGLLRFGEAGVDITFHTIHRVNPSEELRALAVRVPYRQEA